MAKAFTESHFVQHEPCPACGSSDALSRYSDNHAVCFSCDHYIHGDGNPSHSSKPKTRPLEMTGTISAIQDRRISLDTAKRYGVTVEHDTSIITRIMTKQELK